MCVSAEKRAPVAPESKEDVIQIQSGSGEDILTLFPNAFAFGVLRGGGGVGVETPVRSNTRETERP